MAQSSLLHLPCGHAESPRHDGPDLTCAALLLSTSALRAQDAPFAGAVETRHGVMLQMASDLGKIGAMVMGQTPHVATVAPDLSLRPFPAGSEAGKSADRLAKPRLRAAPDAVRAKLNTAAVVLRDGAGTDAETRKAGLTGEGKTCAACHEPCHHPES